MAKTPAPAVRRSRGARRRRPRGRGVGRRGDIPPSCYARAIPTMTRTGPCRRRAQPPFLPDLLWSPLPFGGFGGLGFWSSPVQVIGSKSWVGRKLTAVSSPLLGERKTRQTLTVLPLGNFFGNEPGSHGVNVLSNVVGSTRVLLPSTM